MSELEKQEEWPWCKGQNQSQNKALHWNKNPKYFPHFCETEDGVVIITAGMNWLWYDNEVKVPLKQLFMYHFSNRT